jgi:hypothetical protein
MDLPERIYSQRDVDKARLKGQLVGWLQGGAVVAGGLLLISAMGWIPTVAAIGVGGFLLYKFVFGRKKTETP